MSDDWESIVAELLADAETAKSRKVTKSTLLLLANLLDKNQLPPSGRIYVAGLLRMISEDDADAVLPPNKKKKGISPVKIFAAVERRRSHYDNIHGPDGVHEAVARRLGIKASYVARQASIGRTFARKQLVAQIEAGTDKDEIIRLTAENLGLPTDSIAALLSKK